MQEPGLRSVCAAHLGVSLVFVAVLTGCSHGVVAEPGEPPTPSVAALRLLGVGTVIDDGQDPSCVSVA